jgi:L-alanine-DL-glutamate epimerase-like enolase superfamily enzyme
MLAEEMAGYVALGLPAVKVKIGREAPQSDEARITAVWRAIGPEILLMLDANDAWSDVPTAMRHVDRLAPYDPYWIEEPFSPDQIETTPGWPQLFLFQLQLERLKQASGGSRSF